MDTTDIPCTLTAVRAKPTKDGPVVELVFATDVMRHGADLLGYVGQQVDLDVVAHDAEWLRRRERERKDGWRQPPLDEAVPAESAAADASEPACALCADTGEVVTFGGEHKRCQGCTADCPTCGGSGYEEVGGDPASPAIGEQVIDGKLVIRCPSCDGRGWVLDSTLADPAPAPCATCGGKREVEIDADITARCDDCTDECADCGGSGDLDGSKGGDSDGLTCATCEGRGWHSKPETVQAAETAPTTATWWAEDNVDSPTLHLLHERPDDGDGLWETYCRVLIHPALTVDEVREMMAITGGDVVDNHCIACPADPRWLALHNGGPLQAEGEDLPVAKIGQPFEHEGTRYQIEDIRPDGSVLVLEEGQPSADVYTREFFEQVFRRTPDAIWPKQHADAPPSNGTAPLDLTAPGVVDQVVRQAEAGVAKRERAGR